LLPAARRVLGQGGELVLLDSLAHRARIAPAVAAAGLPQSVIFLPELSMSELAGLFRSADLFCQLDVEQGYPVLMRWALATGLPAVAVDHARSRRAAGRAFLAVDASR
ncbi:MAG: glycosyltransferase, partial [Clostridia bacterium]